MISFCSSEFYTLYQNDKERSFYLDFGQKKVKLSFCQLLAVRERVNSILIHDLFYNETDEHGFKILTFCGNEHLFILSASEIIDLKKLIHLSFLRLGLSKNRKLKLA